MRPDVQERACFWAGSASDWQRGCVVVRGRRAARWLQRLRPSVADHSTKKLGRPWSTRSRTRTTPSYCCSCTCCCCCCLHCSSCNVLDGQPRLAVRVAESPPWTRKSISETFKSSECSAAAGPLSRIVFASAR